MYIGKIEINFNIKSEKTIAMIVLVIIAIASYYLGAKDICILFVLLSTAFVCYLVYNEKPSEERAWGVLIGGLVFFLLIVLMVYWQETTDKVNQLANDAVNYFTSPDFIIIVAAIVLLILFVYSLTDRRMIEKWKSFFNKFKK